MFTLIDRENLRFSDIERYTADFMVKCDGTSLWGDTQNRQVHVTGATVIREAGEAVLVNVEHDSDWDIYTDKGFEQAISAALGFEVHFTEQGMQEVGLASME